MRKGVTYLFAHKSVVRRYIKLLVTVLFLFLYRLVRSGHDHQQCYAASHNDFLCGAERHDSRDECSDSLDVAAQEPRGASRGSDGYPA